MRKFISGSTFRTNPATFHTWDPSRLSRSFFLACGKAMLLGLSSLILVFSAPILAQTFTNLHSFTGFFTGGPGGNTPVAGVVLSGSTLYGTASGGGSSNRGTIFKVNTDGTGFALLHSFTALAGQFYANGDVANPEAGLVVSGSTLYGAARAGGTDGNGTVYAVNTNGTGFTVLHSFTANATNPPSSINGDGAGPRGLVLSGSTLYGTANSGGSFGWGTVFAVNVDGTGFTTLHSFTTGSDGGNPVAGLILSGSTLYGTSNIGGGFGGGTVFAINTAGTGFTTLHSFPATSNTLPYANSDGANPAASLIFSGNTLYGTARGGGNSGKGTVYAVNTDGTGFRVLHHFTAGSDGADPRGGLVLVGNALYGTSAVGGSSGNGTVFAVNTDGTGFTTLYGFAATPTYPPVNSDGANPQAGLFFASNTLFGTAFYGGSSGNGTVFGLKLGADRTPDMPVIGIPIAGNGQVSILFSAPASSGGAPITSYNAICVNGGTSFAVSRAASPITISGLLNGTSYICTVTALNAAGVSSDPSTSVNVTPDAAAPLTLVNVLSRKTHIGVGAFSIDLAPAPLLSDSVTVEPRASNSGHLIVFQFNNTVTAAGTVVAINAVTTAPIAGVTSAAAGNDVAVTLTAIDDNQRIRITLDGVNGIAAPQSASMGFLVGDVTNSRSITASDISAIKARVGQPVSLTNYRFDVNTSGSISAQDVSMVKVRAGLVLP